MNSETKRNGIAISIKDLFLYVLSGWRVLIAGMVIGALLLGAFSGYRSLRRGMNDRSLEEKAIKIESELSVSNKAKADNYAKTIIRSMNDYEFWTNYNEKSLFQAINPNNVIERALVFYIDNIAPDGTRDEAELDSIIGAYKNALKGDILGEKVAQKFGISQDDSFYYYDGIVDTDNKYLVLKEETVVNPVEKGTLLIWIYNEDKDFIDSMQSAVEETIQTVSKDISGDIGKHSITLAGISDKIQSDNYVFEKQTVNATHITDILEDVDKLKEELEGDIYTYTEYLVVSRYNGDYLDIAFDDVAETKSVPKIHISKKYLVVGVILGFAVAAIWLVIIYLVRGRVRCYDDIEYTYGISVLGTYDDPKAAAKRHKLGLDRLIRRLRIKRKCQDPESSAALIAKKLELLAKNKQVENICIAVGPECDIDESFLNNIAEKTQGVKITIGKDILRNAEAIEAICNASGVVILEQVDKSTFAKIDEEYQMCKGNNIDIVGAIVAE